MKDYEKLCLESMKGLPQIVQIKDPHVFHKSVNALIKKQYTKELYNDLQYLWKLARRYRFA